MREHAANSGNLTNDRLQRMGAPDWAQRAIREEMERRGHTGAKSTPMNLVRARTLLAEAQSDSGPSSRRLVWAKTLLAQT